MAVKRPLWARLELATALALASLIVALALVLIGAFGGRTCVFPER
jgi:hypothetical protein